MKKEILQCWCKKCGKQLRTKREYIVQDDTCNSCFRISKKSELLELFEREKERLVGEIEKMKKYVPVKTGEVRVGEMRYMGNYGFNRALRKIVKIIKNL